MKNDPNWKALAVELATAINGDYDAKAGIYDKAAAVLALAAPVEPIPWPGVEGKPGVLKQVGVNKWYVCQGNHEWTIYGPSRNTPAEAIAAWNAVVRAVSGPDEETVRAIAYLCECHSVGDSPAKLLVRRWLAERKGGGA